MTRRRASKYLVFNATVNRFDQTEISRTADDIDETHQHWMGGVRRYSFNIIRF